MVANANGSPRRPPPASFVKTSTRKRSQSRKGKAAASGARAARGAASCSRASVKPQRGNAPPTKWTRHKVRVRSLFKTRHWIYPEDKLVFDSKLDELNAEFKKRGRPKASIDQYKTRLLALMAKQFRLGTKKIPLHRQIAPAPSRRHSSKKSALVDRGVRAEIKNPAEAPTGARQPAAAGGAASGGPASTDLETTGRLQIKLQSAFKPSDIVVMQRPSDSVAAAYMRQKDSAITFMQTVADATDSATSIQWLPQEAADWLYQATHYVIPFLQTLLGANNAFDAKGEYRDASGEPASGGQLVAFWGTEIGSGKGHHAATSAKIGRPN